MGGASSSSLPSNAPKKMSRIGRLVQRNLDTDSEGEDDENGGSDPSKPWMAEFQRYMNTHDLVPEGMSIVEWWGVCIFLQALCCRELNRKIFAA